MSSGSVTFKIIDKTISTNIEFMALGTTISSTDEMTIKAKGLTTFTETGYAKTGSTAV